MIQTRPLYCDLHAHSTASDGTDAPAALVRKAKAAGLSAIALTDHDTVAGCAEADREARKLGIDFLPGIEVSCLYPRPGVIHLLGYGVDIHAPALRSLTDALQSAREQRNAELLAKLQGAGVSITMDELLEAAGGGQIGRPHFAQVLTERGYVAHPNLAYRWYLGEGSHLQVRREEPTPAEAIQRIHEAGGVAVLAHPKQLRKDNFAQLRAEVADLARLGLDGIETIYNDHRESFTHELDLLAKAHNLLRTGGSDYHGGAKKWITLGRPGNRRRVPRERYEAVINRLQQRRMSA
ncbi:MAG: PHP domain-containing protein [Planctomycetota bacterium]